MYSAYFLYPLAFTVLLVVFLLFSIGLNAIFVGILGEYIGRIYDDVRICPQPFQITQAFKHRFGDN